MEIQKLKEFLRQHLMSLSEVLGTLGSFLVRFKVYALERKVGSGKCNGKRCQVCLNIIETDTFDSFQTKQKYKINHHLKCNNKCLIYLLPCKVCGLQYVGSTTDKFRVRWKHYKENDRKALKEGNICSRNFLNILPLTIIIVS